MKLFASFFLVLFSGVSFASSADWVFRGEGKYKNSLGAEGTYTVTTNKTQTDENACVVVKNVMTSDGESMTFSIKVVKDDLGLVKVQNLNGEDIGSGYYFKDHTKKMMHLEFVTDKGKVEKTIVSDLDGYKEIGSGVKNEDQVKEMWIEYGHRIFPLQ